MFWQRELQLMCRCWGGWVPVLACHVLQVALFGMLLGTELSSQPVWAACVLWVAALWSVLWSSERLFRDALQHDVLVLMALRPPALWWQVVIHVITHTVGSGVGVISLTLGMAWCLGLGSHITWALAWGLAAAWPSLAWMAALGAALALSLTRSGLLSAVLVLPWYVPVMLGGVGVVQLACQDAPYASVVWGLGGYALCWTTVCPYVIQSVLRLHVSQSS